ncbi:hypothetical protein SBA2_340004 [Acidobacteriia bacterium SbA2]|nr:hypothetical protein SBA2_340004 [Acidobacteriia bacterium SbA2]
MQSPASTTQRAHRPGAPPTSYVTIAGITKPLARTTFQRRRIGREGSNSWVETAGQRAAVSFL